MPPRLRPQAPKADQRPVRLAAPPASLAEPSPLLEAIRAYVERGVVS